LRLDLDSTQPNIPGNSMWFALMETIPQTSYDELPTVQSTVLTASVGSHATVDKGGMARHSVGFNWAPYDANGNDTGINSCVVEINFASLNASTKDSNVNSFYSKPTTSWDANGNVAVRIAGGYINGMFGNATGPFGWSKQSGITNALKVNLGATVSWLVSQGYLPAGCVAGLPRVRSYYIGVEQGPKKVRTTIDIASVQIAGVPKYELSPLVFDWQFYVNLYPDLVAAGITTSAKAQTHWLQHGLWEGRRGSPSFSAKEYLTLYPDLRQAFGWDLLAALTHWVTTGVHEGREGSLYTHSTVFDVAFYLAANPDLGKAGITQPNDAALHWLQHGIAEGRRAHPLFDAPEYLALNADLSGDYTHAIDHYVLYGRGEGRLGNALTSPLVFDVNYYLSHNPDLSAPTVKDAAAHWELFGITEGRLGNATFSAAAYLARYADLRKALGSTSAAYVPVTQHYVLHGHAEGRNGAP
jgi:hypothetical protein